MICSKEVLCCQDPFCYYYHFIIYRKLILSDHFPFLIFSHASQNKGKVTRAQKSPSQVRGFFEDSP